MGKRIWLLAALCAAGGAAYAYAYPDLVVSAAQQVSGGAFPSGKAGSDKAGSDKAGSDKVGAGKSNAAAGKGGGLAPVTAATATLADMPIILSAPGTVEPLATVAIKPRVDGQVIEVGFKEGDQVTAGDILYRLDDRLVKAQIKQAEAQIARDEASLKDAISIAERRETLFQKRYASEAAAETAKQNVEVLKASIAAGVAQLEAQKTQLDYLLIRAPITGRTGSITARLGTFVRSADPSPLVTINQTKPIAVAFALPQATLQQLKTAMATKSEARVTVPGAKPIIASGVLSFVDNQIDKATGTVTGKVIVVNDSESLWPGQAVTVDLTVETRRNIVAVPASAVLPAQQGMIVWVLGADNKVTVRPVVQERVIDQRAFLSSGLKEGERVVTDGQLRLSPGATVSVREGRPAGQQPAVGAAGKAPGKPGPGSASGG